jgi:hypothetical protein
MARTGMVKVTRPSGVRMPMERTLATRLPAAICGV